MNLNLGPEFYHTLRFAARFTAFWMGFTIATILFDWVRPL